MKKPMVVPKNFTKMTYTVTEVDGTEITLTFPQLCAHFGVKYGSVYSRVTTKGMTVDEAIRCCIESPLTWGCTYYGSNVAGMPKQYDENGRIITMT